MGSAVGWIQAYDQDAGSNAWVDYAIVPGDEGNMFDIISNGQSQEGSVVLKKVNSPFLSCSLAWMSCSVPPLTHEGRIICCSSIVKKLFSMDNQGIS